MGAAIGAFEKARAISVPYQRFAPVKTTDDLLVLRSDVYALDDDWRVTRSSDEPFVALDRRHFAALDDFERRFAAGAPSLVACERFVIEGDVTFGAGVVVRGTVELRVPDGAHVHVPDGAVLGEM
jgi:UTP--glucose-1-phosphate uridylyltransferase